MYYHDKTVRLKKVKFMKIQDKLTIYLEKYDRINAATLYANYQGIRLVIFRLTKEI